MVKLVSFVSVVQCGFLYGVIDVFYQVDLFKIYIACIIVFSTFVLILVVDVLAGSYVLQYRVTGTVR